MGSGGAALGGIVAKAVGGDPKDPKSMIKALETNDIAGVELRRAELEHEEFLISQYLKDVANARAREIAVVQATGKKDINLYMLAWTFVIGFFVAIITMMTLVLTGKMPESMPQYVVFLLGSLFGTLTAGVTAIIQYFFGSSKSSQEKTQMMAGNMMRK
jgi:hypothetical protein